MDQMQARFLPRRQYATRAARPVFSLPVTFEEDRICLNDPDGGVATFQEQNKSEGKFTFKCEKFSQFASEPASESAQSYFTGIRGIPWQIVVQKGGSKDEKESQYLKIMVKCEPEGTKYDEWTCEATVTFKLLPHAEGTARKKRRIQESSSTSPDESLEIRQFRHIFCAGSPSREISYTQIEEMMDPANGWYDPATDSIRIEVAVKAEVPCGVGVDLQEQFLSSIDCGYKFFESGDFSDFVIQFVDSSDCTNNKDFHVHKVILASRSDVFAAMFSNKDTKESRESRVQIVDSTARAIHQMLHFMYAGKLQTDFQQEDAVELLKLADKYQIKHLAAVSEEQLRESLTVENVCDLLVLADLHNAHSLRIACIDLIRDELDAVKQQDKWAQLKESSPELVIAVMEECHSWRRGRSAWNDY